MFTTAKQANITTITKIIKTEIIIKSNQCPKVYRLGWRDLRLIKRVRKCNCFKREYLDKGRECFIGVNIQN